MNIRQAAQASGLPPDTIRFYERKGVLPAPPRRENGYREYTDRHLTTLRLASGLRVLGMPLDQLDDVLHVAHTGTCHDLHDTMLDRLDVLIGDVDRRIAELRATRSELARILNGLNEMDAPDERIPGVEGCDCVRLATESSSGQEE